MDSFRSRGDRGPRSERSRRPFARLLPIGLALGLVLSGIGGLLLVDPAAATTTTHVSFTPASDVAHATSTWTVDFTPGASGNPTPITVTIPSTFAFSPSPPAVTLGGGFATALCTKGTVTATATQLTIPLTGASCALVAGTAESLTIDGITNPAAPGVYFGFTVATALDSPNTPSASVTIVGTSVSSVSFSPSSATAGAAGVTWTVDFVTSAFGALKGTAPNNTITVTFNPAFSFSTTTPTITILSPAGSGCTAAGSAVANVVTISLSGVACAIGASTAVSIEIADGINPAAASYPNTTFSVATGADTVPANPAINVGIGVAANGSGTMTVLPSSVGVASTGDTLVFTYTATGGVVSSGELEIDVPSDWTPPTTTPTLAGFTTSTCGTVATVGGLIEVTGVSLALDASCTITYGSTVSGGPGATAPSTAEISTFVALEASSPSGALEELAVSPQVTVGTPLPTQIYGIDPIGTSIAISQAEFPTAGTAGAVVLARDDFFADALAGGPLAADVGGPLLLTQGAPIGSTIDPRTLAEIERVLPVGGTVYILGGDLAINPDVDAALEAAGYTVVREAGTDEYDTAYLIALAEGSPEVVFEATGTSYYDALSAVPAAIEDHAAILLTDGNVQSYETGIYLLSHPGVYRYAIGGPLAAAGADPGATAVYGQDLFSTSAAVASTFFPGATMYGVATSATFTDALGGGVFMATGGRLGPLLIVNPNPPLPTEILPYLASLPSGARGYVFGGPLAISGGVLTALEEAVG